MAWTILNHINRQRVTPSPITSTSFDSTNADAIVVFTTHTNVTVTDSVGGNNNGAPTRIAGSSFNAAQAVDAYYWTTGSGTLTHKGVGHTVSLAWTPTTDQAGAEIYVVSGSVLTANPVDVAHSAMQNFVSTIQPGSITPAQDNSLILTVQTGSDGTGSTAIDSGFTLDDTGATGGNDGIVAGAHINQGTATAVNPTWNVANNVTTLCAMQIALKPPVSINATTAASAALAFVANPWQVVQPVADTSNTGYWTQDDGTTLTNLYTRINEVVPQDTTFIESPSNPQMNVYVTRLGQVSVPVAGPIVLSNRVRTSRPYYVMNLLIELLQGSTVVQSFTHNGVPAGSISVSLSASCGIVTTTTNTTPSSITCNASVTLQTTVATTEWTQFDDVVSNSIVDWVTPFDVRYTATQVV